MAATVDISETNGTSPGTVTEPITQTNWGSIDAPNLAVATNPITAGEAAFQKWQRFKLTALGGSTAINNLKYYADLPAGAEAIALFNGHVLQATYTVTRKTVYETPDKTIGDCPHVVPEPTVSAANIGIGGSLTGSLSSAPTYSDYIVSIITTTVDAIAGNQRIISFGYDEIA